MIITLDVAFAKTGWATFNKGRLKKFGTIVTQKTKVKEIRSSNDWADRSQKFALELSAIIDENRVKAIIGEIPHGGAQSSTAAKAMASATSIVSTVAAMKGLPVEWTSPRDVKLAITGKANASKEEMIDTVRNIYPNADFPKAKTHFEHIADAIGAYHALKDTGNLVKIFG